MNSPEPILFCWSGGKDSALALYEVQKQYNIAALVTTVTEMYDRVSMHGVRRELLVAQADALAIPLIEVAIPPACSNGVYEARFAQAFAGTAVVCLKPGGSLFVSRSSTAPKRKMQTQATFSPLPLDGNLRCEFST